LWGINPTSRPGSIVETSPDPWQCGVPYLEPSEAGWLSAFAKSPLGPEEIAVLTAAYENILRKLSLVDRNDPITELIAKKVIELGQRGVRDPESYWSSPSRSLVSSNYSLGIYD
jgi:hypothetical protein